MQRGRTGRIARLTAILAAAALTVALAPSAAAQEADPAPSVPPGPPLQEPEAVRDAALRCPEDLGPGDRAVLLVHGTALTADTNFAWGYEPALTAQGFAVCLVDLLEAGMGDNQLSAERVVHAVRRMHEATGTEISIVGYSQGGQVPRWALRWWPDLWPMVDDLVTLSAPNNGALFADGLCAIPCAAAAWQQRMFGSRYIAALNTEPTSFPGIDITSVYTRLDEIATPNLLAQSSHLPGATNIATQDICPANVAEHLLLGTVDAVGFALVVDALTHDGPADPARIPRSVCTQLFLPGLSPLDALLGLTKVALQIPQSLLAAPLLPAEPPLGCYVTASCPPAEEPAPEAEASEGAADEAEDETVDAEPSPSPAASSPSAAPATREPLGLLGVLLRGLLG